MSGRRWLVYIVSIGIGIPSVAVVSTLCLSVPARIVTSVVSLFIPIRSYKKLVVSTFYTRGIVPSVGNNSSIYSKLSL